MTRLVRAEFLKLRTTQVWFWLLLASVAIAAILIIAPMASDPPKNADDVADLFTSAGFVFIPAFVLGVLGVTTEFRYQTITPTVLATPSRWTLVSAKMLSYAVVGVLYAAVCVGVELAIAVPWLNGKGIDYTLTGHHVPRALLGVFAVVALYAVIGLGVGALVKNQIVAVVVGLIFILVINGLLVAIPGVKKVYPFTPEGGASALLTVTGDRSPNGVDLLAPGVGVLVLLLWALVPAIVGAAYTLNRDIT
jgi:hypothetical protein